MAEITTAQMNAIARSTAKHTVEAMLTTLGVDHTEPLEVQKDFASLRELRKLHSDPEIQADLRHLRDWRVGMKSAKTRGLVTVVGLLVTGAATLVWQGLHLGK